MGNTTTNTKEITAIDGYNYLIDLEDIPHGFIGAYVTQWANGYELFNSNNRVPYSKEYISHRVLSSDNPKITFNHG